MPSPFGCGSRLPVLQLLQQRFGAVAALQHGAVFAADKAFAHQMIEENTQLAEEVVDLQQAQGFLMLAKLDPGPDLEELFQGAGATG